MKNSLTKIIDSAYKPFTKLIPQQTFRYAAAGGLNALYGIIQYWFIFNFILDQQDVNLGIVVISAPIFAFLINFAITFFTGFWLTKNIAFSESKVKTKAQIIRYLLVVCLNIGINYFGLHLLVNQCEFYPSIAYAIIQIITIILSFTINKFFTFKA